MSTRVIKKVGGGIEGAKKISGGHGPLSYGTIPQHDQYISTKEALMLLRRSNKITLIKN